MSNLTLTVELDAETKSVLSDLVKELSALNRNLARTNIVANKLASETPDLPEARPETVAPADLKPTSKPVDLPVEDPVHLEPVELPTEPVTVAPADPEPEAPKPIPLGEFQKQIVAMCVAHPEKKANIQAVVKGYAKCVSAIPEDKRAEVLQRLEDLING